MRLTRDDMRKLRYIAVNDTGETSERPSKTLADFTRRGLVEPGPWRQERSQVGRRMWFVRNFYITPAARRALQEQSDG